MGWINGLPPVEQCSDLLLESCMFMEPKLNCLEERKREGVECRAQLLLVAMNRMGVNQRLKAAASGTSGLECTKMVRKDGLTSLDVNMGGESALAHYLIKEWSWGRIPATTVQRVALLAVQDGCEHDQLRRLASLGTSGANPGNIARDLQACLAPSVFHSALYALTLPVAGKVLCEGCPPKDQQLKLPQVFAPFLPLEIAFMVHYMMLPHLLFAELFKKSEQAFVQFFMGSKTRGLDDFDHLIPFKLFGDGVQVSGLGKAWGRSLSCLTLSGLLNQSSSKLQQLLLGVWWKKKEREGTLTAIYAVLAWSLESLRTGLYPTHTPEGDPLLDGHGGEFIAGGYRGIVLVPWLPTLPEVVSGDLEFHSGGFGLNHAGSLNPCSKCCANSTTIPWTNVTAEAEWKATCWSSSDWIAHHPQCYPIWTVVHESIRALQFDVMHCKHLGTDAYLLGSFLCYLHKQRKMTMPSIVALMRQCYKDDMKTGLAGQNSFFRYDLGTEVRFAGLSPTMFERQGGFPRLKGKAMSAIKWKSNPATTQRHKRETLTLHGQSLTHKTHNKTDRHLTITMLKMGSFSSEGQ
eukprot:1786261-Amphidinium_carterae.2